MIREDLFLFTARELRNGATQRDLSERLSECVEAARDCQKAATLTLKLTIKPLGNSGQYEIRDDITAKIPELDRGITLMFGTPDNNLTRSDPRQSKLDLRRVDQTADKVKDYNEVIKGGSNGLKNLKQEARDAGLTLSDEAKNALRELTQEADKTKMLEDYEESERISQQWKSAGDGDGNPVDVSKR